MADSVKPAPAASGPRTVEVASVIPASAKLTKVNAWVPMAGGRGRESAIRASAKTRRVLVLAGNGNAIIGLTDGTTGLMEPWPIILDAIYAVQGFAPDAIITGQVPLSPEQTARAVASAAKRS